MSFRIHVFQHVPYEGLGAMEAIFAAVDAQIQRTCFFAGDIPPSSEAFDLLVIMGGPMGVYDEGEFPWLKAEKAAIKDAFAAGKGVLGICLGSQLMAEALEGRVTRNTYKEIGWWPVERLPEAQNHWVAQCFPERFKTFHWHGDTFSIPPEAVPLFQSEGCAHQGFAFGDKAVALQFHPEILPEIAATWLQTGAAELTPGPYVQTPEQIASGTPDDFAANNGWTGRLCRGLLRTLLS